MDARTALGVEVMSTIRALRDPVGTMLIGMLCELEARIRSDIRSGVRRLIVAPYQGRTRKARSRKAERRMRRRWHS